MSPRLPIALWNKERAAAREADRRKAAELIVLAAPSKSRRGSEAQILSAALKLRWPPRRVEAIWRGEAHRIDAFELCTLKRLKKSKTQ